MEYLLTSIAPGFGRQEFQPILRPRLEGSQTRLGIGREPDLDVAALGVPDEVNDGLHAARPPAQDAVFIIAVPPGAQATADLAGTGYGVSSSGCAGPPVTAL